MDIDFKISVEEGEVLMKKWKEDTRINTSRMMISTTLKNLCLGAIIGYLKQYPQNALVMQKLSFVPAVLKQELLIMLIELSRGDKNFTWESFSEALKHLLNNIAAFSYEFRGEGLPDADILLATSEDIRVIKAADSKIYALLAEKCRNSLKVFSHGQQGGCKNLIYYNNLEDNSFIFWSLLSLTNLTRLELQNHVFADEEFVLLGRHLTKLVNLNCNLLDATWPAISDGLKSMKLLEVFKFQLFSSKKVDGCTEISPCAGNLHHQCLLEFPQLRVVGSMACNYIICGSWNGAFCHSLDDTTEFETRPSSQLEELLINKSITQKSG